MNPKDKGICRLLGVVPLWSFLLFLALPSSCFAQNTKKVDRLNFQLPEDWPVVKRGGLVTPVPTEEYVSMKFKDIEKEFQAVRDDFSKGLSGFQSDLKSLEKNLSEEIKKNQAENAAQAETVGNLINVLSDMESMKSEVGRLDRKITDNLMEVQASFEQMNLKIESLKEDLADIQTQLYKLDEKVDYIQEKQGGSY
ncbi:MAG: hypothetical protein JW847_06690 [Candidatus Omnitrophica bacterium]|nr:hypothetical protein [Candidatus Omnitrophota bacterium]